MVLSIGNIRSIKPDAKNYLLMHGCRIEHGMMLVPLVCPHLQILKTINPGCTDEHDVYYCDIQDTKPQTCKDFDGRPISHGRKYFVPDGCTMTKKWKR
jgi:hypothetical protein